MRNTSIIYRYPPHTLSLVSVSVWKCSVAYFQKRQNSFNFFSERYVENTSIEARGGDLVTVIFRIFNVFCNLSPKLVLKSAAPLLIILYNFLLLYRLGVRWNVLKFSCIGYKKLRNRGRSNFFYSLRTLRKALIRITVNVVFLLFGIKF